MHATRSSVCRRGGPKRPAAHQKNCYLRNLRIVLEFWARQPKRIRVGLRGCFLASILGLLASPALATGELDVECAQLSRAQKDELSARAQLLLHSAPPPIADALHVQCDAATPSVQAFYGAEVRSAALPSQITSPEPILLVIEQLLKHPAKEPTSRPAAQESAPPDRTHRRASPRTAAPTAPPAAGSRTKTEAGAKPRQIDAQAEAHRTNGGVALSASLERWPDPANFGLGPRLDLALGIGSWSLTSFEALRFGSTSSARLLTFDALFGLAWGAPFGGDRWGASLALGREWLSALASPDPTGERTTATNVVNLGLRVAQPFGATSFWIGIDGRRRFKALSLEPPVAAHLARWSLLLSVGVALKAD